MSIKTQKILKNEKLCGLKFRKRENQLFIYYTKNSNFFHSKCKLILIADFRILEMWFKKDGIEIMAIYHPAALLRDESRRPETFVDLKILQKRINEICEHTRAVI